MWEGRQFLGTIFVRWRRKHATMVVIIHISFFLFVVIVCLIFTFQSFEVIFGFYNGCNSIKHKNSMRLLLIQFMRLAGCLAVLPLP